MNASIRDSGWEEDMRTVSTGVGAWEEQTMKVCTGMFLYGKTIP